jgi:hypothetical protein
MNLGSLRQELLLPAQLAHGLGAAHGINSGGTAASLGLTAGGGGGGHSGGSSRVAASQLGLAEDEDEDELDAEMMILGQTPNTLLGDSFTKRPGQHLLAGMSALPCSICSLCMHLAVFVACVFL